MEQNKQLHEILRIYNGNELTQTKLDELFEYTLGLISREIEIPSPEKMLEMVTSLKRRKKFSGKVTYDKKKNQFTLGYTVNAGYAGDWYEKEILSPVVFYFKIIYPTIK